MVDPTSPTHPDIDPMQLFDKQAERVMQTAADVVLLGVPEVRGILVVLDYYHAFNDSPGVTSRVIRGRGPDGALNRYDAIVGMSSQVQTAAAALLNMELQVIQHLKAQIENAANELLQLKQQRQELLAVGPGAAVPTAQNPTQ